MRNNFPAWRAEIVEGSESMEMDAGHEILVINCRADRANGFPQLPNLYELLNVWPVLTSSLARFKPAAEVPGILVSRSSSSQCGETAEVTCKGKRRYRHNLVRRRADTAHVWQSQNQ
jgi:hypothetical protein